MEFMETFCVRKCWGNMSFEFEHSDAVGKSGGILCVWDPLCFHKVNTTKSDSFVMIRGVWKATGVKLMIVSVYAPQETREKQILWEYLESEVNRWEGEVVIMGDFNEVRYMCERFGSIFNASDANVFNSFIADSGLVEVVLGDIYLTIVRFFFAKFLYVYGSDSDSSFHNWFDIAEFNNLVEGVWKTYSSKEYNPIRYFTRKLKFLKGKIREWNFSQRPQRLKYFRMMEVAQKTKIRWDIEGDENSNFFHGMLNKKRRMLNVRGVLVDGSWIDNPPDVKDEFFKPLSARGFGIHGARGVYRYDFPTVLSDKIDSVLKARYWDLIKGDVINAVSSYFVINGDLLIEVQSAFIADRQILDGPFLLNEVIQWCKLRKKQMLIFKVDFEKAYDSVRWDYLDEILRKFGFGDKWCKWIQCCLKSSRGSILVNGSPTKEFDFGRGLKQGDPLSSFLFILVMESLHLSFSRVVKARMFQGISIGDGSVNLSHLFYADDAVFVGQWNASNITTLVHVLDCFHRVSGLRINMCKSKIMGLNVDGQSVNSAARQLGCMVLNIPFIYLGSIVGDNMARQQAWREIVDRVKSKLSNWKMKMLSIGGRLTLVKSVLGSLPIYNFSIFKVPMCVLNELEGIRRKFFNGHEQDSKRTSWVKWNTVLMSKDRGGLGVSSLYAINRGLLVKWVWRFVSNNDSLWARSIKAIHGSNIQCRFPVKKNYNSCWRSILQEVNTLSKRGVHVLKYLQIKLGDGESSLFWHDSWSKEGVLKEKFPRVFALELCKNMNVADKARQRNPFQTFRRIPRGGVEQDQFQQIDQILRTVTLNSNKDSWVWELDKSGKFSVASVRKLIDDTLIQSADLKSRWNNLVPIKVNIHAWRVSNNSLPTRFNISRRGILLDYIICPNCDVGVETTGHSFFSCSMVRDINLLIARWWNITIDDFDGYDDWSSWIDSIHLSTKAKKTVEAVFYISWWLLWWYRNSKIFKEKIPKKSSFFDELQSRAFLWCRFRGKKDFGWNDWLKHPECISL
ncbi:RNA-directed DNA polymerase, eukaryota, reverse transcriptase zinc-binding domain protein [Tanacetum coccineum]